MQIYASIQITVVMRLPALGRYRLLLPIRLLNISTLFGM